MSSIRRQLLAALLAAVVVAGCLSAIAVYYRVLSEAGALFDYQLRQIALSLRDQARDGFMGSGATAYSDDVDFAIEIRSEDGARLYYSRSRVMLPLAAQTGYATVDTDLGIWRLYTLRERGLTLRVAQPVPLRDRLAAQAALRSLMPFLLLVPLLAALVWFAVKHALKPLETVASAVKARSPASLQALPNTRVPEEIKPVVSALNDLLERLARALETQRAFVADAAHELRTPLTALSLQIQLVERAANEAERAAALDALKQGFARATRLVEQLLTLAREEPEIRNRQVVDVDLGVIAADVVAAYAPIAEKNGIDLGMTQQDPQLTFAAEEHSIRMLISNLVDNALRYTPRHGHVDVSAIQTEQGIVIEVSDDGPGVPPDERDRVFDRFYRHAGTEAPGSGLGLAIVRSVAQRHSAKISLDTGLRGSGLTARVAFPKSS